MPSNKVIGYTTGVYDLFHVGHLHLLRNAKSMCDYLIVGVSTDELVYEIKDKRPIIPFNERIEILSALPFVDVVVAQSSMDKMDAWQRYKFDIMFVGDDWKGSEAWNGIETKFGDMGVKTIYFPYTKSTSSTKINHVLESFR